MRTVKRFPVFTWTPCPLPPTGRSEMFMDLGGFSRSETLADVVAALVQYVADKSPAGYVEVRNVLPLGKR
jgi:hypothetical protein